MPKHPPTCYRQRYIVCADLAISVVGGVHPPWVARLVFYRRAIRVLLAASCFSQLRLSTRMMPLSCAASHCAIARGHVLHTHAKAENLGRPWTPTMREAMMAM